MNQTGQSKRLKVDGPEIQRWISGEKKKKRLYDPNTLIWTVSMDKNRRSKGIKLDGLKKCKWRDLISK